MTVVKNRGGMGTRKHGKSSCRNKKMKSPRFRHWERREAEKDIRKRRNRTRWFNSISDLMKG